MAVYALSKLNFINHSSFFKYLLLLSGDINLNPGPTVPCCICSKSLRQKVIYCNKCHLWFHKKCITISETDYKTLKNVPTQLRNYTCYRCHEETVQANTWDELPLLDNYLEDENHFEENLEEFEDFETDWEIFKRRGLHFIHININSITTKIDQLRYIAQKSEASVIGISESKLDKTVLDSEIEIVGYEIERNDRNRHGGGVVCYIKQNLNYNVRNDFGDKTENLFIDILLPKTKPILLGIMYRPPDQNGFLRNFNDTILNAKSFSSQEVYILGDININLLCSANKVSNGIKAYREFCSLHGLKQLIKTATRITKKSSSLLDHVITNSNEKVGNSGVIDVGLSDHQMIFCSRKITRAKFNKHNTVKIRSLKHYTKDLFLENLRNINFPNYQNYDDVNEAYTDLVNKIIVEIDKIAPLKEIRIKNSSQEWFDEEIIEHINKRDKLFQKFKKSREASDELLYKRAKNRLKNMIKSKKKNYMRQKLADNIGKPKELWKTLKSLGLPSKTGKESKICLEDNGILSFDAKKNAETFMKYFSNLAGDLVKKLPTAKNKFGMESVKEYYENLGVHQNNFCFHQIDKE